LTSAANFKTIKITKFHEFQLEIPNNAVRLLISRFATRISILGCKREARCVCTHVHRRGACCPGEDRQQTVTTHKKGPKKDQTRPHPCCSAAPRDTRKGCKKGDALEGIKIEQSKRGGYATGAASQPRRAHSPCSQPDRSARAR
jgi:hypothetical protein